MRICVPLSPEEIRIGKKQHCWEIPVDWPREFRRLGPERWWTVGEKVVDVAQDLQILASIDGLARELSPEFRKTVQAGIEQAAHSMKEKLPEGVELHFREQTAE